MPRSSTSRCNAGIFTTALVLSLLRPSWGQFINGQWVNCYWPNNSAIATTAGTYKECSQQYADSTHDGTSVQSDICCPQGWQCYNDFFCLLPQPNLNGSIVGAGKYARYGCANQKWEDCQNPCNDQESSVGGEQILQCAENIWCCNRDTTSGNCCYKNTTWTPVGYPYFYILDGDIVGTTSFDKPVPSTLPASANTPSSTPASTPASTTSSSLTSISSHKTTKTTTNAEGHKITVTHTLTPSPDSSSPKRTSSSSSSNIGLIVGCAVGIPVGLVAIAILGLCFWRQRRKRRNARDAAVTAKRNSSQSDNGPNDDLFISPYMIKRGTAWNPSEADSLPIGNPRRIGTPHVDTPQNEKAELAGDEPAAGTGTMSSSNGGTMTSSGTTDISAPTPSSLRDSAVPPYEHAPGGVWGKNPDGPVHELPAERDEDTTQKPKETEKEKEATHVDEGETEKAEEPAVSDRD